jgi:hypothetical protein
MLNFWENIFRYPRFFISSMMGLVSIIIGPFIYLFKKSPNKVSITLLGILIIVLLITILNTMIEV